MLPGTRSGRDPARSIRRGPSRVPPEVVAATQRDRLLDGVVHTVAAYGYAGARVSDICQAAGVTRPVFYEQFSGKEEAFLAAHRHGTAVVIRRMEEAVGACGDWCEGVYAALRVVLAILAEVPAFATLAVVEVDAVGPAGRLVREQLRVRLRRLFAECPAPPAPVSGELLVDSVVGGIYANLYRYIAAGRHAELPGLLPTLAHFAIAAFVGPVEATRRLARAEAAGAGWRKPVLPCVLDGPGGSIRVGSVSGSAATRAKS
ncbi:TetR/AcrR family transcriptional regulator [Kitasatospora sp. NBC_01250]|uniref:TetR/AcrR family transcriptional regulator n=1 Tax=unclassified Kitasatospora TaxID=2633591 RepID=UPI002E1520E1|nr:MULTISPECIES: TetR/AcrR family transcriptional regulator [unclassified Kitasatospora]WSJ70158.1 TetR/AcrR family transcriptional regulator [Kitasatospora sp. NBC_01302]